jgi:Holliday junction DNA helicase RuvA
VTLFTHLVVREDAHLLFGFGSDSERRAFRQLVKISGVGARTALSVLSGLSVVELAQAVTLQESGASPRSRASARRPPSACCSSSRTSSART